MPICGLQFFADVGVMILAVLNAIRARPPFICMVLSTENTVIFVSLFLPGIMQHISKRKTKKFIMQTQRFLIWGPVKSRQAAVIWLKYMTRKDVFVI